MNNRQRLVMICLLAACAAAAAAQEGPCGALDTAGDGLCDAYCESMDCDGPSPEGNAEACAGVFDAHKRLTGTAPPCEAELLCPCAAEGLYHDILNDPSATESCAVNGAMVRLREADQGIFVAHPDRGNRCGTWVAGEGVQDVSVITLEEAGACRRLLRRAAHQAGLTCS